jgi:two-component system sensor histidine kinase VanS
VAFDRAALRNWAAILLLIGSCGFCCYSVLLYTLARRRGRKKAISKSSQLLHRYFREETKATELFPPDYLEISAEAAEIKAVVQRQVQLLKEETARKNDLVTYLAHDLKTPLTSIIGYLNLLDEMPEMPLEKRAKYVGITLQKAYRLEQLVGEFFEITRYNLQQIVLQKETFDLNLLFEQLCEEFALLVSARGNSIALKLPPNLTMLGDPDKLARVFGNILKNAVAYSYPNTPIVITAEKEASEQGSRLRFVFTNQGATIPEHRLAQIFEKFFRLDSARATQSGGAGLGLAIAKEIVQLHGGEIWAESDHEEIRFIVLLPQREN